MPAENPFESTHKFKVEAGELYRFAIESDDFYPTIQPGDETTAKNFQFTFQHLILKGTKKHRRTLFVLADKAFEASVTVSSEQKGKNEYEARIDRIRFEDKALVDGTFTVTAKDPQLLGAPSKVHPVTLKGGKVHLVRVEKDAKFPFQVMLFNPKEMDEERKVVGGKFVERPSAWWVFELPTGGELQFLGQAVEGKLGSYKLNVRAER